MAVETGVSVVPTAMKNTDRLMGKGTGTARAGTIEMVILPPIETEGLSADEDVKRLTVEVRARVAEELRQRLEVRGQRSGKDKSQSEGK